MPLLFCLFIYLVLYFTVYPLVQPWVGAVSLLIQSSESANRPVDVAPLYQANAALEKGDTIDASLVEFPTLGAHYAKLSIERIGMVTDVYYGDDNKTLKKGAGQYTGSMIPGFGQPTLICGHNNKEFNLLQYVEVDDIVKMDTHYGAYEYRVTGAEIMQADVFDEKILREKREMLILYTCYPFRSYGINGDRFFVYAEKISGPTVVF